MSRLDELLERRLRKAEGKLEDIGRRRATRLADPGPDLCIEHTRALLAALALGRRVVANASCEYFTSASRVAPGVIGELLAVEGDCVTFRALPEREGDEERIYEVFYLGVELVPAEFTGRCMPEEWFK